MLQFLIADGIIIIAQAQDLAVISVIRMYIFMYFIYNRNSFFSYTYICVRHRVSFLTKADTMHQS